MNHNETDRIELKYKGKIIRKIISEIIKKINKKFNILEILTFGIFRMCILRIALYFYFIYIRTTR